MVSVRIFDDISRRPSLAPGLELVPQHVPVAKQRVIWSKPVHPHFHLKRTSCRNFLRRDFQTSGPLGAEEGSICPSLESPRVPQFEGKYELEGVKRRRGNPLFLQGKAAISWVLQSWRE